MDSQSEKVQHPYMFLNFQLCIWLKQLSVIQTVVLFTICCVSACLKKASMCGAHAVGLATDGGAFWL